MRNQLICTVGLPRSGKTTWAKHQGHPIVNPDSIRLSIHGYRFILLAEDLVWAIAKVMVRSLFLAGHGVVILDATNVSKKRRDEWQWVHSKPEWDTSFKVFVDSMDKCIKRARKEGDEEIVPIIIKMATEWEFLGASEVEVQ